jgi:hypothetical protein
MSYTEEVIHNLETLIPGWVVRTGYIDKLLELGVGVISEEREYRNERAWCDIER